MTSRLLLVMMTLCTVYIDVTTSALANHPASLLHEHFFENGNYHKQVRPKLKWEDPVTVHMQYHLISMMELDEESQTMVTYSKLELRWQDDLLAWDKDDYGGIDMINLPQEDVWLPDIAVDNSADVHHQLGYKRFPVQVNHTGTVYWNPTLITRTQCDIVVTYYPFDTQICEIIISTEVSTESTVDILSGTFEPYSYYSPDGTWKIIDSDEKRVTQDSKPTIKLMFLLERRNTFYIVSIVAPVVCLSLTSSLVFALPGESGEKMGTGITVVLAFDLYLIIIADYLPDTSLSTSILAVYLTVLLAITTFSVVITAFTLRLHHAKGKVGRRTTALIRFIQRITCRTCSNESQTWSPKEEDSVPPPDYLAATGEDNVEALTWAEVADAVDWLLWIVFTFIIMLVSVGCVTWMIVVGEMNKPTLPTGVGGIRPHV